MLWLIWIAVMLAVPVVAGVITWRDLQRDTTIATPPTTGSVSVVRSVEPATME